MFKKWSVIGALCAISLLCYGQASNAASLVQFAEFTTKNFTHVYSNNDSLITIAGSFTGASGSNFQYDVLSAYNPSSPGSYISGTFTMVASLGAFDSFGNATATLTEFQILDSHNKNLLTVTGTGNYTDTTNSAGNGTISLSAQNYAGMHTAANTVGYTSSFLQFASPQVDNYTLNLNVSTGGTATGKFSTGYVQPVPDPSALQFTAMMLCSGGLAALRFRRA